MKITKYEHACWDITEGTDRVIVDPGEFSTSLIDFSNTAAVIITHVHGDHLDKALLQKIIDRNPEVIVFGPQQVADTLSPARITVPTVGEAYKAGSLKLMFNGEKHHLFDDTDNIAVTINGTFFIPGDSYTKPNGRVKVAAVPVSAPWFRIDEGIANIKEIEAETVVPTHDALLSDIGQAIHYRILGGAAQAVAKNWQVLKVGESLEL